MSDDRLLFAGLPVLYSESLNKTGLFGGFGDPVEVRLRRFLPS